MHDELDLRPIALVEDDASEEAEAEARTAVELLVEWGTQWDKRMPFSAWLNWSRCLALQASLREWPSTHGGIESLGATLPRMRFRGLNAHRSMAAGIDLSVGTV